MQDCVPFAQNSRVDTLSWKRQQSKNSAKKHERLRIESRKARTGTAAELAPRIVLRQHCKRLLLNQDDNVTTREEKQQNNQTEFVEEESSEMAAIDVARHRRAGQRYARTNQQSQTSHMITIRSKSRTLCESCRHFEQRYTSLRNKKSIKNTQTTNERIETRTESECETRPKRE